MPSKKPQVFEHLFYWRYDLRGNKSPRWDERAKTIPEEHRMVYSDEVVHAIRELRVTLGNNQAANFTKDFLRKSSRSLNWPKSLADIRWTIKQQTGKDPINNRARNFFFKPYETNSYDPFPDDWPTPTDLREHAIQSVTISVASKQLQRMDETRLMQIVVDLRIVETHFALFSPLSTDKFKVVHMDHLQMGLKLRGSEVDGLYLAEFMDETRALHPVLITVEAKKYDEFINTTQVISQVIAVSGLCIECEKIVAIALKEIADGVVLFEFEPFIPPSTVKFTDGELADDDLRGVSTIRYRVMPSMIGLSNHAKRPRTLAKTRSTDGGGADPEIDTAPLPDEDEAGD